MAGPLLLGVDVGTTNLKVAAVEPGGRVIAVARRSMVVHRPAPGAAEFDLDAVDRDLVAALAEVAAAVDAGRIAALGVVSIGESYVGLDAGGRRVTPCPTWYDRRTVRGRDRLGLSTAAWYDRTGMVDDDIYTVHRLAWLHDTDAALARGVRLWLNVADYVTLRLSGAAVAGPSLAARSGLADRATGDWSEATLAAAGIRRDRLPRLAPAATVAGGLRAEVAARTGLPAGIPVVNAGHDHPAAGVAVGLAAPGNAIDSTGTSESLKTVLAAPLDFARSGGRFDCYPHALPGLWLLSAHVPSSGGLIDWLTRLVAGAGRPAADALMAEAAASLPGAGGVRVEPYLEGTGQPWNARDRRGSIAGLAATTTRGDLMRATLEALAAWLDLNVAAFEGLAGRRFGELILVGGGSRAALSTTIKAAMLDRPIRLPAVAEAAAAGAALVAGLGAGIFATPVEAAGVPDLGWTTVRPDADLARLYAALDLAGGLRRPFEEAAR
ncbi:MAG: FGGY family carbohydrate kinase [Amaricoccus sp.]